MDITETNENDLYATDEHWVCGLDDEAEHQLGIYAEVLDYYEATGDEEYEECPYLVSFSLIPHKPSEKSPALDDADWIDEACERDPDDAEYRLALMRDAVKSYGGTVPVNRQLSGIKTPDRELPKPAGKVVCETEWRRFEKSEDAQAYARAMIEQRADGIFMLVGFVLDCPVNGIGETGWDWLGLHLTGERVAIATVLQRRLGAE